MVGTGKRVSRYGEQNVCEREDEHSLTKREPVPGPGEDDGPAAAGFGRWRTAHVVVEMHR